MAAAFNGYTPPTIAPFPGGEDLYGPDPYDYNFCFQVGFSRLETDRVALTPLIPRIHARLYFDEVSKNAEIEKWIHIRHDTLEHFLRSLELWRRDSNQLVLAIIDKGSGTAQSGSFAGIIGLIKTSAGNLSTEMGPVIVLPHAQRTYVTSNAVGLLLRYCLEVPAQNGLGLRRVQWSSHPANVAAVQAAVRMGFKREGMLRWTLALPDEKKVGNGRALREGDSGSTRPGRDTEVLAFCFGEWEAGGCELVQSRMDRR